MCQLLCVLEQLRTNLRRSDVVAEASVRCGDPLAQLLDGEQWEQVRDRALLGLGLAESRQTKLMVRCRWILPARTGEPDWRLTVWRHWSSQLLYGICVSRFQEGCRGWTFPSCCCWRFIPGRLHPQSGGWRGCSVDNHHHEGSLVSVYIH